MRSTLISATLAGFPPSSTSCSCRYSYLEFSILDEKYPDISHPGRVSPLIYPLYLTLSLASLMRSTLISATLAGFPPSSTSCSCRYSYLEFSILDEKYPDISHPGRVSPLIYQL
ncbi:hypothetical protein DPMN_072623 [Dreissena polymorpha]|uniref:Uncharacterized protein n=1 Tax=Dreissena polymorpha TaxID=45954 RepID=A0A9D4BXL7_DREPO|nr:hypothetical protein DPMN_072623 [Dreissena polymorpha]